MAKDGAGPREPSSGLDLWDQSPMQIRLKFAEPGETPPDPVADHDYHRDLLWQQVWEYLVQECCERASRRRHSEESVNTTCADRTVNPEAPPPRSAVT
jgi:hypothetical protein